MIIARRLCWISACILVAAFSGAAALAETPGNQPLLPALFDVTGVTKGDVLNIRASPDPAAAIIGNLPPDARGVEVSGVQDGWGQVNLAESAGFVRMSYLVAQTAPGWDSLTAPLTCFGTEPFWSLSLTPDTGQAIFATPEDNSQLTFDQIWPGSGLQQPVAVGLDLGFLVMTPATCSDGMSDRGFGISAALFPKAAGQPALHGCCSIAP